MAWYHFNFLKEPNGPSIRADSRLDQSFDFGETGRELVRRNPGVNTPIDHLEAYMSSGFAQAIVDSVAEDATREWFELEGEPATVERMEERFEELKLRERIKDLIRFSRIFPDGAILYFHFKDSGAQELRSLEEPPRRIEKLEYINVVYGKDLSIHKVNANPLLQNPIRINAGGQNLHPERYAWLVQDWISEMETGVSTIDAIYMPLVAHSSAVWSSGQIAKELLIKIIKTKAVNGSPEQFAEYMSKIKDVMNTKTLLGIDETEDFVKQTPSLSGLKDLFEFILSSLSGAAQIPKSRLMGNAQGTLAGADNDLISYYDMVSRYQENELSHIIKRVMRYVLMEPEFRSQTEPKIEWKPLWKEAPKSKAEREKLEAETAQIYLNTGILAPSEIRQTNFPELDEFTSHDFEMEDVPDRT